MEIKSFLKKLNETPELVAFDETMAVVDAHYDFTPTAFQNGETLNAAGQNNGSCKLFSFARLQQLTPQQTLHCFGAYYREDVLKHPEGTDHQNIRNFVKYGWNGIEFGGQALTPKKA